MIQIEFLLINVGQKSSVGEVLLWEFMCAIGTGKKKKKKWKKKELKKCEKSTKVLFVEERVQNNEFGPKNCLNLPLVFLSWFLHTKVNSKFQFHYFAYYRFENVCFPYPSFVNQHPKPRYNPWLQSWVLCVSICGVWIWYEHMVSLILASK